MGTSPSYSPRARAQESDPVESWALVERVQAGDAGAFDELYRMYQPDVFTQVLRGLGGQRQVAEDLTQDVFVRAWIGMGRLEWQGRDLRAWLFTVARNAVRDHFRRAATRLSVAADDEWLWDAAGPDPDRFADPAEAFEAGEVGRAVRGRVKGLCPQQRQVVGLRFFAGLSTVETAAVVGVSASAVRATQYRALEALR